MKWIIYVTYIILIKKYLNIALIYTARIRMFTHTWLWSTLTRSCLQQWNNKNYSIVLNINALCFIHCYKLHKLLLFYYYWLIFINIWFAIWRLNQYILYDKGLSKGMQATQSVAWNDMYKWTDDLKYPGYEPEQLCAHQRLMWITP